MPDPAGGADAPGGRVHVVGHTEQDGAPVLWVLPEAISGTPSLPAAPAPLSLSGRFAWRVEGMRTCIGQWHGGLQVPCPESRIVTQDAQCLACSGFESPECVFEPRCQVDPASCTCLASFKGVEHVVYAAFYGTLPKVGMTQAWRVERRLREQGADAYFTIQSGLDRPTARITERAISLVYKVPEHRSHREVLPQLTRPVPWDLVERRADELRLRLESGYAPERVTHRITDHPVRQPLPGPPRRIPTHGSHAGEWLGAKGNHLFYVERPRAGQLRVGSSAIAGLKRSDLLGRHITLLSQL